MIKVQLVSAKDSSVLLQDTIMYNPLGNPDNVVTIPPAPDYAFADVEDMQKRPAYAVEGLKDALARSAQSIGSLLK